MIKYIRFLINFIRKDDHSLFNSDILIIGAGITGCSVARSLSRYSGASVLVIDRASDIAEGATKANSGIVHAGYDAVTGTEKAKYNVRGVAMYPSLCESLGVPYQQCGALVIGFTEEDRNTLNNLLARGIANGVEGLRLVEQNELLSLEPNLNPRALFALLVPSSGIVSPYELAFAMADDAAVNGVSFRFDEPVLQVKKESDGTFSVQTSKELYSCRVLINCAGASSADLHNQLSERKLAMVHRRGQYYLLDHAVTSPFKRTIFQCPSAMGKGVLVSPTVHGNILLGPSAEDISDPLDTATTKEGLDFVLEKARLTWPAATVRQNITNFSGVRAHLVTDDFVIGPVEGCDGAFEAAGIESPGLSSAPAVGESLAELVAAYLSLTRKDKIVPYQVPSKPFRTMTPAEQAETVAMDSAYGNLICRCEVVTEAEIRAAIRRPVGARSIDGVKRRTRAGMGRCQGGFCMPRVAAILAEELNCSPLDVTKNGGNSRILCDSLSAFLSDMNEERGNS